MVLPRGPEGMLTATMGTTVLFSLLVLVMAVVVVSGLRRAGWTRAAVAAVVLAYLVLPAVLARAGALDRYTPLPAPALLVVLVLSLITVWTVFSRGGAMIATAVPVAAVVLLQAFRIVVEWLLHRLYLEGVVPVEMTYSGRNWDIVSGLTGLGLGLWLLRGPKLSRPILLAWNLLGLGFLLNIITIAVLCTPVPFRQFTSGPPNLLPSTFPYVWLPSFLVQLAFASHLLVFRQLKRMLLLALVVCAAAPSLAAQAAWQPAAGHTQQPIWPGAVPDARPVAGPEVASTVVDKLGKEKLVGGKPWIYIDRVAQPTMTVYAPRGRNSGAAVVVFPGGGYNGLAIDLEGTEACDWLTSKGITCVLLKYRVPCAKVGPYRDCPTALQDAQRTVGLVRSRAAPWQIDPRKIGVLGFSAGGHMVAALSTHFDKRLYPPVDAADRESCRPDFAIALYPGHIAVPEKGFALNPNLPVTGRTPPTFLLHAEDDPVDPVENTLVYGAALRKAGVSAEMHVYAKGGHAFGLRPTEAAITRWPQLVETWLASMGVIR